MLNIYILQQGGCHLSSFKELIKSFPKTREYVRDFFVYGFKTRDEFKDKSSRTYDNERRRIESWLADFVNQDYTAKGKNISLAIDSNLLDTNPLYRVWKTKSFTDNDIMLHFFIFDILSDKEGLTIEEITDTILICYQVFFDVQTVRRKCNAYVKEGLLHNRKEKKELIYYKNSDFKNTITKYHSLENALEYFQLSSPLGIIGNTILDNISKSNNLFRVKHSFFVHTLEDEVLLDILGAMQKQYSLLLNIKGTKSRQPVSISGVPLQLFISTRTGRRFLCLYSIKSKRFTTVRMDAIKSVELLEPVTDYTELKEKLKNNHKYIWGVSFQNGGNIRQEHIKITIKIIEETEGYILKRLENEGKGGTITKIGTNLYTYEKDVFDTNEMLPWIRTFIGRIVDISCTSEKTRNRFYNDMETMYRMYGISDSSQSSQERR